MTGSIPGVRTLAGRPGALLRVELRAAWRAGGDAIDTQGTVEHNDGSQAWTVAAPGFAFVVATSSRPPRTRRRACGSRTGR